MERKVCMINRRLSVVRLSLVRH